MKPETPFSRESETGMLACILMDEGVSLNWFHDQCGGPDLFHDPQHRMLYAACLDLEAKGVPPSYQEVAAFLKMGGNLEAAGGHAKLIEVTSAQPTTSMRRVLFDDMREIHARRQAIAAAHAILADAEGAGEGFTSCIHSHVERLLAIVHTSQPARTWAQAVHEAQAAIENDMRPPAQRETRGEVSWGFPQLDRAFCPMEPGELVVVAARTSCGKSSFARQVWLEHAKRGAPCLFHTMEVRDSEFARNLVANISGVPSRRDLHKAPSVEKHLLFEGCKALGELAEVEVRDRESGIGQLLASARAFKRRHGGLSLWVIDYLGLIREAKAPRNGETVATAIGRITSTLKQFASEEKAAVMLLSQINRAGGAECRNETDEGPTLVHLKDSGSIEEDANRVIIIHRPRIYQSAKDCPPISQDLDAPSEDEPSFYCLVTQAKGRNHGTARIGMTFDRDVASFRQFTSKS